MNSRYQWTDRPILLRNMKNLLGLLKFILYILIIIFVSFAVVMILWFAVYIFIDWKLRPVSLDYKKNYVLGDANYPHFSEPIKLNN